MSTDYRQNLCARGMRIGVSTFRAVCQIKHGRGGGEEGGSGAASKGHYISVDYSTQYL